MKPIELLRPIDWKYVAEGSLVFLAGPAPTGPFLVKSRAERVLCNLSGRSFMHYPDELLTIYIHVELDAKAFGSNRPYTPERLKLWKPVQYMGRDFSDYYPVLSRHRDADAIMSSNFDCALLALGAYDRTEDTLMGEESQAVRVFRIGHPCIGYYDSLMVHRNGFNELRIADRIAKNLDDYSILCEDHLSYVQDDEAQNYWGSMSLADRIDVLDGTRISKFAARRQDWPGELDDQGTVLDRLVYAC